MKNKTIARKVLFTATVDLHILQFHIPYLKWFKEQGYEVHVATNGDEEIPYCDIKHKVLFERSPLKINNIKAIKQLKKIIKKEKFSIIHCHTPMGSVITRIAAIKTRKKYNTKVIYTAHGFHFYKGASILNWIIFYPVEKILSYKTDCLITINEEDYKLAKEKFHSKRIELVYGVGVDENKFNFEMTNAEKHKFRKEIGLEDDDFVMIYPAELSKRKNQGMLLDVMKMLKNEGHNNIKLILPGLDSVKCKYREMAKKLGVEENVKFLGYRKDIPKLLKISDLVVSTSKQEGLPVSLIEAIMSDLPIVATDCRGNRDLINNGENGYIVKDKKEMKDRILEFTQKEATIIKTENKDIEKYKIENILKQVIEIYKTYKKIKIIHILNSRKYSGAENVVINIIKNIQNEDFDLIYVSPKGDIANRLEEEKIKYILTKKTSISEVRRIVKQERPDIIHAHDYTASIITAISGVRAKIISHLHSNRTWIKKYGIYSIMYYMTTRRYNKILTVSNSIMNEYVFRKRISNKAMMVGNPIDTHQVQDRLKENVNDISYDILFVGRLCKAKNPIRYIELIKEVRKFFPQIKTAMIGDGKLMNECKKKIKELEVEDNIEMLGFCDNPYSILKKAKVLLMTSDWEGFPMVATEALILGVPVIANNVDGLPDIIDDSCGKIVNSNQEFLDEIEKLLKNENILQEKKRGCTQKIKLLENKEQYYKKIKGLYRELMFKDF